jgi:carbonic anhydrase
MRWTLPTNDAFTATRAHAKLQAVSGLEHLLENNKRWASRMTDEDPRFFADLAGQQAPEYLWIGCSDSRVSANTIVDLMPGQVFVHRNVANLVTHTDMNCLSVMQFAIEVLKVKHIIVCGHYGCGGVLAALGGERHGLIDNWLRHIQDTANHKRPELDKHVDGVAKSDRLCELNVIQQVINVGETTIVQDAWRSGQEINVHGWIYGLKDGHLRDLQISTSSEDGVESLRKKFYC